MRKLKQILFPDEECKFAMKRGGIDLITVIPPEHLEQGVTFMFCMSIDFSNSFMVMTKTKLSSLLQKQKPGGTI